MFSNQLLFVILNWLPKIFFIAVFLMAIFLYFKKKYSNSAFCILNLKFQISYSAINYKLLIVGVIVFRVFYAVLLSVVQYYVWLHSKFAQILFNSPLDKSLSFSLFPFSSTRFGYFLFYSYGRFWLNALISIGIAFAFYLFLKFLQKHRERFFESGETELGFLMALLVGWPNFIIFLPLVLVLIILISIFRGFFLKEAYTTFGWPFILATLVIFLFGNKLIQILDLGALKI